ncbi:MAG: hypothetical protein CVU68_06425 [Deltaproteobacteria bacterium HGW-Deltaproteobacteria-3]|nr:MAG: hypothetical protein CVU68_06425 [Deltaproteobacteria bacterium HGW-Deltaproteobacteria-3]
MNKMRKNKPRKEYIYATTSNVVDNISLSFDTKTGGIRFETEVKDTYSEITYDRAKGPKVISRTPQNEVDLLFGHHAAIENNYEIIFAVDTNTVKIHGRNISVSGIIQAQKIFAVDTSGVTTNPWQYFTPFCIELTEIRMKPENIGWMLLIKHIQSEIKYTKFNNIGIIVDSDLGNLKEYNSRNQPIFDNFLLPEKFQLIYASSDTGKDLFANKMLKYADKASSLCLEALRDGTIPLNTKIVENQHYSGIRYLVSNLHS